MNFKHFFISLFALLSLSTAIAGGERSKLEKNIIDYTLAQLEAQKMGLSSLFEEKNRFALDQNWLKILWPQLKFQN